MAMAQATPMQITQAWGLICLTVWLEIKERQVDRIEVLHQACTSLVGEHADHFLAGTGPYEHPAVNLYRARAKFSEGIVRIGNKIVTANLIKSDKGESIKKKGQEIERYIRNDLIPLIYQCSDVLELRNNSYTFKSGKSGPDLLASVKRILKTDASPDADSSRIHPAFLAFEVFSVFSNYVHNVEGHVNFKDCILPSTAATDTDGGRGFGRKEQRDKKKMRLQQQEVEDASGTPTSTSSSSTGGGGMRNRQEADANTISILCKQKEADRELKVYTLLLQFGNESDKLAATEAIRGIASRFAPAVLNINQDSD
jgi:hypothetical protein